MQPTSLIALQAENEIRFKDNSMSLFVRSDWIIQGEDRLAYTSIIRLAECLREYHWQRDIIASFPKNKSIDSILKNITADFQSPIIVNKRIKLCYQVSYLGHTSYHLNIVIKDDKTGKTCAIIEMVNVFYRPDLQKSTPIPVAIRKHLETYLPK